MKTKFFILLCFIITLSQLSTEIGYSTETRQADPRIVGGIEAAQGSWPWMVAIIYSDTSNYQDAVFCGGVLITSTWVVTAAHCVKEDDGVTDMQASDIDVLLGVHDMENDTGERIRANLFVIHPNYNYDSNDSDIALIELSKASTVKTISTYSSTASLDGKSSIVMGWGDLDESETRTSKLMQVTLPIVSNTTCNNAYNQDPYYSNPITVNMLCAGYAAGGKDACSGDSGGPLIVQDGTEYKLAGIVSWGEGCALKGYYGVYTRVPKFISFIESTLSSFIIQGSVTTNFAGHTNLPVVDATVKLSGTEFSAQTSQSGTYSIVISPDKIQQGLHTMTFESAGLKSTSSSFTINDSKTYDVSKEMIPVYGDFNNNGSVGLEDSIGILKDLSGK